MTAIFFFVALAAFGQSPLTRIEQVKDLSAAQAAEHRPVHVRGVVTWKTNRGIIIQDETAGTWLHMNEARAGGVWKGDQAVLKHARAGDVLDVEGVSLPGAFSPGVMPAVIRLVGTAPVPPAKPMDPARFFSGADDGIRVKIRGVIQNVTLGNEGWRLGIDTNPGKAVLEFPRNGLDDPRRLVDAEVEVVGVATCRFNTRGEMTMARVFAGGKEDLAVIKPGTSAESAPLVDLDSILKYRRIPLGPHRMRVRGVVTYCLPGQYVYLQNQDAAIRVEAHSAGTYSPGDIIEASGFPDSSRFVGGLSDAEMHKIGTAGIPAALDISPEEILRQNQADLELGKRAKPHDYDGHLIRTRGTLLAVRAPIEGRRDVRTLALARSGDIIIGSLTGPACASVDRLQPGSELEVCGLVQLEYNLVSADRSRLSLQPTKLSLILRAPEDVVVVGSPSWWTAKRLWTAMAIAVTALAATLLWVFALRRQIRIKTLELTEAIGARRNVAVEFQATLRERNRLAANLHDTLLQTLGGISFELGACEVEASPKESVIGRRLAVARRILDLAVTEVRNSVWAMRTLPLVNHDLGDTIRAIAVREAAAQSTDFTLTIDGDASALPEFVAGGIVLTAQEAMRNAVRHGKARKVEVRVTLARQKVELEVRDDGIGFVLGEQKGPLEGHFGLIGMRERIEHLDGSIEITSTPGIGTRVRVAVPLLPYDAAVV